jgi:hypothetical protein
MQVSFTVQPLRSTQGISERGTSMVHSPLVGSQALPRQPKPAALQSLGTSQIPVSRLQVKQFGQTFGEQTPVAASQVWQAVHLGTHWPFTHFWHLSPLHVEHTPFEQVWHSAALHFSTHWLFWHF